MISKAILALALLSLTLNLMALSARLDQAAEKRVAPPPQSRLVDMGKMLRQAANIEALAAGSLLARGLSLRHIERMAEAAIEKLRAP